MPEAQPGKNQHLTADLQRPLPALESADPRLQSHDIAAVSAAYVKQLEAAADFIRRHIKNTPEVVVVLGSGLGDFAHTLHDKTVIPYSEIPFFPVPSAKGHAGNLVSGRCGGKDVIALQGRVHCYEGHHPARVAFAVRTARLLGIQSMVITNAAGGTEQSFGPGDLMLITNHLSLLAVDPSQGLNHPTLGDQFYDQTFPYSAAMRKLAKTCARKLNIDIKEGVYVMRPGPAYESALDIKFLAANCISAVGMSTIPETQALKQMGVHNILGVSLITNMGAGISSTPLNHKEVTEAAEKKKPEFTKLLSAILKSL